MPSSFDFYIDIQKIHLAHERTLDQVRKCEYPRGRGSYGLIYALEGQAEYRFLTSERICVTEGDVLFISPDSAYVIAPQNSFRHYTVNFDIHESSSSCQGLASLYCLVKDSKAELFEGGFKKLLALWETKKTGYEMQATGVLYELISWFFMEYTNQNATASNRRLMTAKEHIDRHFDQSVSLAKLAYLSNMSVTNFRREWGRSYAQTPMQYRDSVRMIHAKELLKSGYYTVSEVAEKCGFDDISYFVRFFRKKTGMTPGEFKKESPV